MGTLLWPVVNSAILFSALYFVLRKPIGKALVDRHNNLRKDIDVASERLKNAKEQYDEYSSKLKAIEAEVSSIKSQAVQDAQAAKTQIVEQANTTSKTMVSDAKEAAESRLQDLQNVIRTEFGMLVVDRAEALLTEKATGPVKKKIIEQFSKELKEGVK